MQREKESAMNVCKYCQKSFKKEQTLAIHLCEPRRRFNQKNEKHVVIGFSAYLKFYEITQGNSKIKTYEDFSKSPYYSACVRFGKYVLDINCVNIPAYTEFLIKNNCAIDKWCSDKVYEKFLQDWTYSEDHFDAAQRSLITMAAWAEEQHSEFNHYFNYATNARIIHDIACGQISAWVIYNSDSGQLWLEKLNSEELSLVWPWINTDRWMNTFMKYPDRQVDIANLMSTTGV